MSYVDIDSDRFQDLPYDVLYNIFLCSTGYKTIAALQATCRRCYQIGSEEDALWKNQVEAFYPSLVSSDRFFVGYYFKLRNHASAKKLSALTSLVNSVADKVSATKPLEADSSLQTLLLSSEINLSKGVCLGSTAGLIFKQISSPSSSFQPCRFSMLDTLNLNGQHLRAEGLEYLAAAAQAKKLPNLKTLSLRQNKLGAGIIAEQKRCGEALALLLNSCQGSITSLDLSENNIVGKSGLEKLLLNSSILSNVTSAGKVLCLPARLTLNKNHLGVIGVAFLLSTLSNIILKHENRNNTINPACQELLPLALGLQNVGLGFNFESFADNSGKSIREGAPRASMDELLLFMEEIHKYDTSLMGRGCQIGGVRLEARQAKALAEARKKLDKVTQLHAVDNDSSSTSNMEFTMMKQKILSSLSTITRTKQIMFESFLVMNDENSESSSSSSTKTSSSSSAAALTASLTNVLPKNLLQDGVVKKKPEIAKFFQLVATASTTDDKKKKESSSSSSLSPKNFSSDGIARLNYSWPAFNGEESGSSCVIC